MNATMKNSGAKRKRPAAGLLPAGSLLENGPEAGRTRQRQVCGELLDRWVPLATSEALALRSEGRGGPVIDEDPFEAGLKAGAFVLKVLERLARLDGLDAAEKKEITLGDNRATPLELAERVKAVTPLLQRRVGG